MKIAKILIGLILVLVGVPMVYGSDLDNFENSVSDSDSGGGRGGRDRDRGRRDWDDDDDSGDFFLSGLINGLLGSGSSRHHSSRDRDRDRDSESDGGGSLDLDFSDDHVPGGFCVPTFRTDVSWQHVNSDMEAIDYRVQVGYGPFALDYNQTRFNEWDPDDGMDIHRVMALLRISSHDQFEIDLGVGTFTIDGERNHTEWAATIPVIFAPSEYVAFEFRPVWTMDRGHTIQDFDLNGCFKLGNVGFRGGYRWLMTETQSLNGPYVGITVRF